MSRPVIRQGLRELLAPAVHPVGRIRRPGGGRKKARQKDPTLVADLEQLVEPTTRGHPETCLRWTCKSVRKLAEELNRLGPPVSYPVVAELLHELDYSVTGHDLFRRLSHIRLRKNVALAPLCVAALCQRVSLPPDSSFLSEASCC